jgi:hypothetical protein
MPAFADYASSASDLVGVATVEAPHAVDFLDAAGITPVNTDLASSYLPG